MEILASFANVFTTDAILMLALGTVFGIFIGAIPGLGNAIGIAVMLPFTYTMQPLSAICLLSGIYMGCAVGGSISGILLNIPGTAESVCTTIEGYPMTQKGRGMEALYLSGISSTYGGVIGCLIMIFFAPFLARVALKFGPAEMAIVAIIGLTIIASLSAENIWKGLLGASFGMLVAMIGIDPIIGRSRLTFGFTAMTTGFKQVALALGLIAGRQVIVETMKIFKSCEMKRSGFENHSNIKEIYLEKTSLLKVLKLMKERGDLWVMIKSAFIGSGVGILPGAGVDIAAYVAYDSAKRGSKEKFKTGVPRGIVAAESANNAAIGGAFVPMLALGIPGSNASALIFGALTIHGIVVGPTMFTDHADLSYGFMVGLLVSAIIMGVAYFLFTPTFAKIVKVHMRYLIPPIVGCVLLGAYSIRNNMFDVYVMIIFTAIGYLFYLAEIPIAPVFLGFILQPIVETNLSRAAVISKAQNISLVRYIVSSPVCLVIIAVGVLLLLLNIRALKIQKSSSKEEEA